MEKLKKILTKLIEKKFPESEVDNVLASYGELLMLESLEEAIEKLGTDTGRQKFSTNLKNGNLDEAFDVCEQAGFSFEDILEKRSLELFKEFFS